MPNTREKLIEILRVPIYPHELADPTEAVADYLLDNGVKIPVLCENCTHHDTESCPENRVWCRYLRRYMKPDGYCSYGE